MSTACRTRHKLQYRIVHATSACNSYAPTKLVYPEALDGVPSDELEEREIQRLTLKRLRIEGKSYGFTEGSRKFSSNFAIIPWSSNLKTFCSVVTLAIISWRKAKFGDIEVWNKQRDILKRGKLELFFLVTLPSMFLPRASEGKHIPHMLGRSFWRKSSVRKTGASAAKVNKSSTKNWSYSND